MFLYALLCFHTFGLNNVSAAQNPFDLPTDSTLPDLSQHIEDVWSSGQAGEFAGESNVNIKYMRFPHPDEVGAVVISSGRTESYIKYREMIYILNRTGYSVYIHDHRGQGFSGRIGVTEEQYKADQDYKLDPQMGHVLDFNNYVLDLKNFYTRIIEPSGHENLYLLAHSMGGGIATLYIQEYPDDFIAAALSSPMHEPKMLNLENLVCRRVKNSKNIRDNLKLAPRYVIGKGPHESIPWDEKNAKSLMTHSKQRYESIQALYDKNPEVKLGGPSTHWLANACDASDRMLESTDKIKIPVLVLQIAEDVAVTADGQNTFCQNLLKSGGSGCVSENGGPVVIEGAYHELFIESDQYRIPAITKVLEFFEKSKN